MMKVKTSPWCWRHHIIHSGCPHGCKECVENINPMFDLFKRVRVNTVNSSQHNIVSGIINGEK